MAESGQGRPSQQAGVSQVRVRQMMPAPAVTEHSLHAPYELHDAASSNNDVTGAHSDASYSVTQQLFTETETESMLPERSL